VIFKIFVLSTLFEALCSLDLIDCIVELHIFAVNNFVELIVTLLVLTEGIITDDILILLAACPSTLFWVWALEDSGFSPVLGL
jgi:hypothetical protein